MATMSREDSRIHDGVRDPKIRLDIPRKFNQKIGTFTSELNPSKDGNRCHEEECYLSQYITSRIRMKIRFFNGSPGHFVEWTEAVEDFFLQMDIPEQLKCKIASYSLEGETDRWWQQLQHTRAENGEAKISSWEEMKRQLIRYCFPPVCSKLYHIQSSRAKQEERNEGNNSKEDDSPRGRADKFIPSMCLTKCPNQLNKPKEAEMIEYIQADGSILAKCSTKVPSESYSSEWDEVKELKLQKSVDVCKGVHEAEQALGVETEYNMVEELSGKVPIVMLPKIIEHEVIELLEAKRSTINMKEGVWHEGSDPKIMELEHTAVAIVISKEHLHIDAIALQHLSKVPTLYLSFHNLFAVKLSIMFDPGGKWQNKRTGNDGHVSMTDEAPTLVDSDATTLERVKLQHKVKFMNNRHLPTIASVMAKRFWEPICISNNQNSKLSYEHRGNIRAEELKWMTRVVVVLKFSLDDNKRSTCLNLDNWGFKHHCLSYSNSNILMEDKIGTLVYNSSSHRVVGSTENEVIMMVQNLGAYDVDFLIKETLMCSFDPGERWSDEPSGYQSCQNSRLHDFLKLIVAIVEHLKLIRCASHLVKDSDPTGVGNHVNVCSDLHFGSGHHLFQLSNNRFTLLSFFLYLLPSLPNTVSQAFALTPNYRDHCVKFLHLLKFVISQLFPYLVANGQAQHEIVAEGILVDIVWLYDFPYTVIFEKWMKNMGGCVQIWADVKFGYVENVVPTCDVYAYGDFTEGFVRDGLDDDKHNEFLRRKVKFMVFHGYWNCNFYMTYMTRGRVIPWKGWNDVSNFNPKWKFIMAELTIITMFICLSILGDNGKYKKTLKLFRKVVNGLDPPDLDGARETSMWSPMSSLVDELF